MYIARIGHIILNVLRYKVGPGNHQRESPYFRNFGNLVILFHQKFLEIW